MGRCFQVKASTKWQKVASNVALADLNPETFEETCKDYLEAVAEIKNLGDCLIRQLRDRAKPVPMSFNEYLDRRNEWKRYINGNFIFKNFDIPDKE